MTHVIPRSFSVSLLCLLLIVAAGGPALGAQESDVVTLTVSVTAEDGTRVGSATLEASWDGGNASATTASNGKAFLDVPAGAQVRVDVRHPEYVRNDPFVVENASERAVDVPVFPRGALVTRVVDGGSPVEGATVVLRKGGAIAANGETGEDGQFASGPIEQGQYGVEVVRRGYYRNTTAVTVDGNVSTTVPVRSGSVTVEFTVTDPHFDTPRPVGNATVAVESVGQFQTLTSGEATARVPVNARLEATVSKPEYETTTQTIRVGESNLTVNLSLSRTPALELSTVNQRVVAGERVVVEVVDEYGDPVEGAEILLNGTRSATTDANGQARVQIQSPGERELRARAEGVTSDPVTVEAVPSSTETTTAETAEATTTEPETTTTGSPGFGLVVGAVALLAVTALLGRRRGTE
jgi:hypothetical protein